MNLPDVDFQMVLLGRRHALGDLVANLRNVSLRGKTSLG